MQAEIAQLRDHIDQQQQYQHQQQAHVEATAAATVSRLEQDLRADLRAKDAQIEILQERLDQAETEPLRAQRRSSASLSRGKRN